MDTLGFSEHYLYYRDKEWLKDLSSHDKACDWIVRQRQNTMKYDEEGKSTGIWVYRPVHLKMFMNISIGRHEFLCLFRF